MPEYFTLPELRALPDMGSAATYPDAAVELAAAFIVATIEREVGTSFVARTKVETHDGGDYGIVLRHLVLSVTSVTENGVTVTPTPVVPYADSVLYRFAAGATTPTRWASGVANIVVTYQAGYSLLANIPGDIKDAALQGTRARLLSTRAAAGQNARRKSLTTEAGNFELGRAGAKDAPTGFPEVDSVICGWRDELDVLGFA